MKKLFPLAVIAVVLSFTSCKKNYTCTCTETVSGVTTTLGSTTINATKSNAKSACNNSSSTYANLGVTVSCSLN